MKIYITTCDQYSFILEPSSILYNRYWPGQSFEVLGFDESLVPSLPENFKFTSLGNQSDGTWSDMLIPFFNSIDDEYFTLVMDDTLLMDYIDFAKIECLTKEFDSGMVQKAYLFSDLNGPGASVAGGTSESSVYKESELDSRYVYPKTFPPHHPIRSDPDDPGAGKNFKKKYTPKILEIAQDGIYRTSLSPAIWSRDYFLSYLKPGMSPWDFEIANMPQSKVDGARIISIDQSDSLFTACNIFISGGGGASCIPHLRGEAYGSRSPLKREDIDLILTYLDKYWHNKED